MGNRSAPEAHSNTLWMDEGKSIGSQTHSAGLLPAGFGLARRRKVPPPPQRRPTPPTPQNQLAQAARAWQRPQNALPSAESARTPRRVRGSHTSCAPPLPLTQDPSVRSFQGHRHTCTHHIPALRSPSELARAARAWQRPKLFVPPRVERAVWAPRRVRGSVMTPWTPLDSSCEERLFSLATRASSTRYSVRHFSCSTSQPCTTDGHR